MQTKYRVGGGIKYHTPITLKKNKGFTLIELLAVIVVLAIIAMIAVPTVLNIIEKAREGAAKSSAMSYIKAVETYIVTSKLDNKMEQLQPGETYSISQLNNLVELKGTKPTDGTVVISNKNSVASARLVVNTYVINYDGETDSYKIDGKDNTPVTPPEPEPVGNLLSDVANVGDYVAYDAGEWTSTTAKPTTHGNFGGYTSGQNKANTVEWCYNSATYSSVLKGWRVLSIDKDTKTVILVHAGISECYYHGTNQTDSINKLNARAASEYLNTTYAASAHMMNRDEVKAIIGTIAATTNDLRYLGPKGTSSNSAYYWQATDYGSNDLGYVYHDGSLGVYNNSKSYGVRPVIVLKSGIKTTGKGTDAVGQEAWTLVQP